MRMRLAGQVSTMKRQGAYWEKMERKVRVTLDEIEEKRG